MQNDEDKLLNTNQAFYAAFASADFASLSALWSRSDMISVIHPGRSALHGRHAVMDSWRQILDSAMGGDIQCTNARAYIHGNIGYVICQEVFPEGQLIATNVYIREGEDWRMVHHQAGPDNWHELNDTDAGNTSIH